jgi:hypothetical protein
MKGISLILMMTGCAIFSGGCCTSLVLPRDQTNFQGIAELATNAPQGAPLRLFMIHGMSAHPPDWGEAYLRPLEKELGKDWKLDHPQADHPVQWSDQPNDFVGNVRVYELKHAEETRITVYQLTWSRLTDPFKAERFQADLTAWRPVINQTLRTVVDSHLSDVVLYLSGFDRNVLNKTVRIALTNFYTGTWDPEPATRRAIPDSQVAVITESLGSLMFVDGLRSLAPPPEQETDAPLAIFLTNARVVFMMANQLNLLEMPAPEPAGPAPAPTGAVANEDTEHLKSLRAFLRLRYNAMHRVENHLASRADERNKMKPPASGSKPFYFVAFNDPYDVLTYKITTDDTQDYAQWVAVDNFAPRNACDLFGLYESPADAHDGYKDNQHVVKVVVDGYRYGKDPVRAP